MKFYLLPLCAFFCISVNLAAQTFEWGMVGGSNTGAEAVTDVVHTPDGNTIAVGPFSGVVDFDPGPATVLLDGGPLLNSVFAACYAPSGMLVWARCFRGTHIVHDPAADVDAHGNIYIATSADDTLDADPGPGVVNHTSAWNVANGVLIKLDPAGNYLWSGQMTSPEYNLPYDIDCYGSGVILTGTSSGATDLDPTAGTLMLSVLSSQEGYVVKMDTAMNFLWAYHVDPTAAMWGYAATFDAAGDVWAAGTIDYAGTVDLDPGAGTVSYTAAGNPEAYLLKLSGATGAYLWHGSVGGAAAQSVAISSLSADAFGNVYAGGSADSFFDIDPGPGVINHFCALYNDLFLFKVNSSGVFQWGGASEVGDAVITGVYSDSLGNVYISGYTSGTIDLDFGSGVYSLTPAGVGSASIVASYRPDGTIIWAGLTSAATYVQSNSISCNRDGGIAVGGAFRSSIDLDPFAGTATFTSPSADNDFYLFQMRDGFTCILDSISEIICSLTGYIGVQGVAGVLPYHYTWSTGDTTSFITPASAGIYTVTATDSTGAGIVRSYLMSSAGYPSGYDLQAAIMSSGFRPGFSSYIFIDVWNNGCTSIAGTTYLVLDTGVSYVTSVPAPSSISGDTLFWNFPSMNMTDPHFTAVVFVQVPATATAGSFLCFDLTVTPFAGDLHPSDNIHLDECFQIVASLDPNDKKAWPNGSCPEHFAPKDEPIQYTIRFQNTGTADAINVYILDTLDADLDLNSVNVKAHSHPMWTEVLPGNVLKFVFNGIYLPDSATDEPGSHGYVVYEATPLPGLPDGTQVHNGSAIYFDFNEPVITNVFMNTLMDTVPPCIIDAAHAAGDQSAQIRVFPNPAKDMIRIESSAPVRQITLLNSLGVQVAVMDCSLRTIVPVSLNGLSAGMYILQVQTAEGTVARRFVVE